MNALMTSRKFIEQNKLIQKVNTKDGTVFLSYDVRNIVQGKSAILAFNVRDNKLFWFVEWNCVEKNNKVGFFSLNYYSVVPKIPVKLFQKIDGIVEGITELEKFRNFGFGMKKVDQEFCKTYSMTEKPWPSDDLSLKDFGCSTIN